MSNNTEPQIVIKVTGDAPSAEDIQQLALQDPTVAAVYQLSQKQGWTQEEFWRCAIVVLLQQKNQYFELYKYAMIHAPAPQQHPA